MTSQRDAAACVFCGGRLTPDEPLAGRPPMAAHTACADAALADDRHWDAVAGRQADASDTEPTEGRLRRSTGCLTVLALPAGLLVTSLLAATAH